MNCLIRVEYFGEVEIEGYEQPSLKHKDLWVFEISYNQESIPELLQDIQKILIQQKKKLQKLVESGADVFLFLEHEETNSVRIKKETLELLGEIGATLEIYHPER
jgi:hypothetical protein